MRSRLDTVLRPWVACVALAVTVCALGGTASAQSIFPLASPASAPSPAGGANTSRPAPWTPAVSAAPAIGLAPPAMPVAMVPAPVLPASEVFGAQLFTGAFAREGAAQFNPDYVLATGDTVQVRLWGAFDFDAALTIDPQGNIFLPHVGPVQVRGVRNQDLQALVDASMRRVFRSNVNSYASLAAAQPVRIFVSGFVVRPGLYGGTSMDGLLHYLDQAGGVDTARGSFLAVQVRRNGQLRATVNLYDFLLHGQMPLLQLATGDVILVMARQGTVKVGGLAAVPRRFEFASSQLPARDLLALARPAPSATHLRVVRNTGTVRNSEYYPLSAVGNLILMDGDDVELTADKMPGTITIRVEGEHLSAQEYVLAYGSRLRDVLPRVQLTERSQVRNLQLFRQSVKVRQKEMLAASLRSLEAALLTARSGSSDEARLRTEEAALTLQWVDRAKQVEPLGQVLIAQDPARDDLLLENGDVIRIPAVDHLVLVSGEVLFPNAIAHERSLHLTDYIRRAGGFTQTADNARVVLARADGSFEQVSADPSAHGALQVNPGDQLLVLPKVDEKKRQFWKDLTQILFQIAVSAKVVLGL
jgi:protein involved in polysaccharide export with SLBB domain